MIRRFLIFSLWAGFLPLTGQTADYLVVEQPSDLFIYNKYQQRLNDNEVASFARFSPFRILNANELLSDQIRHASRCSFENDIFFIIKNEDGDYSTTNPDSYFETFSNCELIQDTLKVLLDNRISIRNRPKRSRSTSVLHELYKNEWWIRVFSFQGVYFLKSVDMPAKFGWAELPRDGSWEIYTPEKIALPAIPERLTQRIENRIASANRSYQQYFEYFNKQYNQNRPVPVWELITSERSVRGTLSDFNLSNQLKGSTAILLQDLENILLGSGLSIDRTSDGFIIQERQVQ